MGILTGEQVGTELLYFGGKIMQSVKRIEIFANSVEQSRILEALERADVLGHTVIKNVCGKEKRGKLTDDLAMSLQDNVYIIAFFHPEQQLPIEAYVRPILNKFGGSCFISDAIELETTKCAS